MAMCGKTLLAIVVVTVAVVIGLFLTRRLSPAAPLPEIKDGWFGRGPRQHDDDTSVRAFKVAIPDDVITDLFYRLDHARLGDDLENTNFQYGFQKNYLIEVIKHWRQEYDWRQQERELNRYPQYLTKIEGIDIHFLHAKAPKGGAKGKVPVLITHGWPGSVWEFYKLIPRLTEPEKYGGHQEDAVDVICPSIPGYGFSEPPHQQGFNPTAAAQIFLKLMRRLGYEKFYVQGGDWGAEISTQMAQLFPSHIRGIHLNIIGVPMFDPLVTVHRIILSIAPSLFLNERDQVRLKALNAFGYFMQESGYVHIQATKPDTVATGLNDSPVGLAAYILEKFSTWTDPANVDLPDGGLTKHFDLDDLLTNVMIYWTTGTIGSSVRFYKEFFSDAFPLDSVPVDVPAGLAALPHEILQFPTPLIGYRFTNVVQYTEFPTGGHFAALEQPELMARDILKFVKTVEDSYKET